MIVYLSLKSPLLNRDNKQGRSIVPLWYGALWLVCLYGRCGDALAEDLLGRTFFCAIPDKNTPPKTMFEKEKTIAFTGNRNLTSPDGISGATLEKRIRTNLNAELEEQYQQGKRQFLCGMALGFDMLAAEEVLKLQETHPDIELIAVIPFDGQEEKFPHTEKLRYRKLCNQATSQITIATKFSNQAYHDRNDYMLANTSKVIAYHNGKPRSGTGSTIRKTTLRGVEVVNLYEIIEYTPPM